MKGIGKLFLGLFLMTLIGVASNVDVKAVSIDLITPPEEWGSASATLTISTTFDSTDFPASGDSKNIVYEVTDESDNSLGTATVTFDFSSVEKKVTYNGNTKLVDAFPSSITDLKILLNASTVQTDIQADGKETLTVQETGSGKTKPIEITANSVSFSAEKLDGTNITSITTKPSTPFYILNGYTLSFEVLTTQTGGYKFYDWKDNGSNANPRSITMESDNISLVARYKLDDNSLVIDNLEGASVVVSEWTGNTLFKISKNSYGDPIVDHIKVNGVTVNGTPVNYDVYNSGSIYYFKFKAPNTEGANLPLVIKMNDGAEFKYNINVVKLSNIGISFPQKSYSVGVNSPTTITLSYTGVKPKKVTYTSSDASSLKIVSQDDDALTVTVEGLQPKNNITLTAEAEYDPIGGTSIANKEATTIINVQTLKMKDELFVVEGLTVPLYEFISTGDKSMTVSTITDNSDYVDINGNVPGSLSGINVKGAAKGSSTKDKFVVDGNEMKATVYTKPSMTFESAGLSGNSTGSGTYTYTVTMPKGVYHDEKAYWVENLSKAKLVFKSSSDDPKTKEIDIDGFSDNTNDTYSKKATKRIDVRTLTGYLKDICRKDEETVSVTAYAINGKSEKDDKVKTDSKEIKAYKITLDTNGGNTSYTVNGDSINDYFYKIDGVEYTVVANGTGKLDKTSSVNFSNPSSEGTGTATIKLGASGSGVLGEKRIKAAFSGSNDDTDYNNTNYDNQPEDGESTADIWILWSVLFISILGAGFMIWKRFGLVRAIAEADEEVAVAEHKEEVKAKKKEKEDKIKMLKDLRNL